MYAIDICAICRDSLSSASKTLVCNHVFHAECIDAWTARVNQCPYCRTVLGPAPEVVTDDEDATTIGDDSFVDELEQRVFDEFLDTAIDFDETDSDLTMDDDELSERAALFHGQMFEAAVRSGLTTSVDWERASLELTLSPAVIKIFIDAYNRGEINEAVVDCKAVFDNFVQFQDLGADIIRDNMTLFDMYLVSVFQSPETKYELGIDTPLPYNIAVLR